MDAVEALPLGSTATLDIQRGAEHLRLSLRLEAAR
jgi:hypothetical protein